MLRVATGISIHCPEETGHRFNRPSESYSSLPLSLTRERTFKVFFSHQIPGGFAGRFAFCVVSRLDLLCHCNSEGLPGFPHTCVAARSLQEFAGACNQLCGAIECTAQ